jgi:hypothetical protein
LLTGQRGLIEMSQLLIRLDRELQIATDAVRRGEIRAKTASYLARVGRFAETRALIGELRQEFGDGRSGHVTALIMLAEGLLHHYESLDPLALDRVTRSQVLGLAMNDASIVAIASAWKAHIEFEMSNFSAMVDSVSAALTHAKKSDHDVHTRVAIVLCNSFLICGDRECAQFWFLHGRDNALKDGDQASIEALQYNRAAFGLARLRAEKCLAEVAPERLSLARLEISSAKNLQVITGVRSLTSHVHLCDVRLMILEESFAAAIIALHSIRNAGPFTDRYFDQSFIDLELAFCLLKLNRLEEAFSVYSSIDWNFCQSLDIDEQLVVEWMRSAMCVADSMFGSVDDASSRFKSLAEQYHSSCLRLSDDLRSFRNPG